MGTRGFYGFRYKKKYYMIYNQFDSYYSNLGLKLLKEVRQMVKNNEFAKWLELFEQLQIIKSDDAEYTENSIDKHAQSFVKSLNSKYIIVENDCLEKINYNYVDGEFFYILDFDKKRFIVKENGYRRQKYNLFNGEINKVYFEDSSGEESEN
jgi:hypothetical protein